MQCFFESYCCCCCPLPDNKRYEDPYLKMNIPNNRNNWPVANGQNFLFANGFDRSQMRPTADNPAAQMAMKGGPSTHGGVPSRIPYE